MVTADTRVSAVSHPSENVVHKSGGRVHHSVDLVRGNTRGPQHTSRPPMGSKILPTFEKRPVALHDQPAAGSEPDQLSRSPLAGGTAPQHYRCLP